MTACRHQTNGVSTSINKMHWQTQFEMSTETNNKNYNFAKFFVPYCAFCVENLPQLVVMPYKFCKGKTAQVEHL